VQEFEAFRETVQARQESLIRQLAADNAAADEARSLRQELDLERRHCSVLEATLTEARSARNGLEGELASARSRLEDFMAVLEREREELASLKIAAEAAGEECSYSYCPKLSNH
jgi:chromosome segregation ATPase